MYVGIRSNSEFFRYAQTWPRDETCEYQKMPIYSLKIPCAGNVCCQSLVTRFETFSTRREAPSEAPRRGPTPRPPFSSTPCQIFMLHNEIYIVHVEAPPRDLKELIKHFFFLFRTPDLNDLVPIKLSEFQFGPMEFLSQILSFTSLP